MWKRWKEKVIQKFKNENSNNDITDKRLNRTGEQDIKPKISYQYPRDRSFRFPIIPDETVQASKKEDAPAYVRRKQQRNTEPVPRKRTSEQETRKIYKRENAPPFQASDVPSPIYGFQKPKNKIEDVPAFQRKKESQVEKIIQEDIPSESYEPITVTEEIKPIHEEKRVEEQKENKMKSELPQRVKSRKDRRKGKQENQVHPYNVVMNPIDKQRYQEKKRMKETSTIKHSEVVKQEEIPLHLLNDPIPVNAENDLWMEEQQRMLEQTLSHFNVSATVVKATQGPAVTRFEVQPDMGVKVSKIRNLSDDLKLNMSAKDIRIEAPIPGKNTVGIEVPNPTAQTVGLQEIFETEHFKESKSPLSIALGLTIEGEPKVTNIQKMPHGLIAGATGSGKSVCINSILISILYKASHEDVKFLLIDPKMVELAPYNGIPHLVAPVITDVKAATQSLKWAVNEMEERYERFVKEGVRDIERYNNKVISSGRREEKMPFIVIVIDELADLMMMSPQDVENSISRIAQKARACGIHLLLATQRPSVDVITGLIKANIPTRIAFSVSSQIDSRTILDSGGAEKLLGKGDMLFIENGKGKSVRLQGPFVSDEEIERVTAFARSIAEPNYLFEQEQLLEQFQPDEDVDELLEDVIQFVLNHGSASTSMLQRHFKIGYNRAARLIDNMELKGIISGQNGSKPREVLVTESAIDA
ncbi:DNA translocase FtsK [Oceanobacillus sp. CAU 1775]